MAEIAINSAISANLKRSPRRTTIGIKVQRGQVFVSAPTRAPLGEVQRFVQQKVLWIERHLREQQQRLSSHQVRQFQLGDTLLYLGQPHTLSDNEAVGARLPVLDSVASRIHLPHTSYKLASDDRKLLLERWYVKQAIDYLEEKVTQYAAVMQLSPKAIKVRHYKSRWGSCNSRGELQFNWLIMMAPPEVIDYVVVHELAHLRHMNHSEAFWRVVERVIPAHRPCRAWLKRNQTALDW